MRTVFASFLIEGVYQKPIGFTIFLLGFFVFFNRPVPYATEPFIAVLVVGKKILINLVGAGVDRNNTFYLFLLQFIQDVFPEISFISGYLFYLYSGFLRPVKGKYP